MNTTTEVPMSLRIGQGDPQAWAKFVDLSMPKIQAALSTLSDDTEKREDAASEILLGIATIFSGFAKEEANSQQNTEKA